MLEKETVLGWIAVKPQWAWPRRSVVVAFALFIILIAFVGGVYAGRWAVRNQGAARLRAELSSLLGLKPPANVEIGAAGDAKNTDLVRIEDSIIHLPDSDGGFGGGLQALEDGRIFYATRTGEFGVIGTDGITRTLPFKVEMNLAALKRHPIYHDKKFDYYWVKVTDINLNRIGPERFQLLVGHHYFDPDRQCFETRLSRAVLNLTSSDISIVEPFKVVFTTKPCITINDPDYEYAFLGHFSGGRIARYSGDEVLFTTGDHGWVGLRGYPAVSQDEDSTLGKTLLVNVKTGKAAIFAKGHRNPQGLTIDSKGQIWETEQGPRGGDELNLIVKGGNYGWPNNTYGTDYGPLPWPLSKEEGRHTSGITPQFAWNPSIGVTNLIEVTGKEFPFWKGDLLVTSLNGQALHRLRLEGTRVVYDEPIRFEGDRLRDLVELPDGRIALLTDRATVIILRNSDKHSKSIYLDPSRQEPRSSDMTDAERAAAVAGRYAKHNDTAAAPEEQLSPAEARGELAFKANCAACHTLNSPVSGIGPSLKGIMGRRVGTSDYAYSEALAGKNETWTSRRILDFATNPGSVYAGTAMSPVPLSPDLRQDLEKYLEHRGQ